MEKEGKSQLVNPRPWLDKLILYFINIKSSDDKLEQIRTSLCQINNFSAKSLFELLDEMKKNFISLNDFIKFFLDMNIPYEEKYLRKFVHNFDKDEDFSINFNEFLGIILPIKNNSLRENILSNIDKVEPFMSDEIKNVFANLLVGELALVENSEKDAKECRDSKSFTTYESYIEIAGDERYITENLLYDFLRKNNIDIPQEDIHQLMARIDSDNDGQISFPEFREIFFPVQDTGRKRTYEDFEKFRSDYNLIKSIELKYGQDNNNKEKIQEALGNNANSFKDEDNINSPQKIINGDSDIKKNSPLINNNNPNDYRTKNQILLEKTQKLMNSSQKLNQENNPKYGQPYKKMNTYNKISQSKYSYKNNRSRDYNFKSIPRRNYPSNINYNRDSPEDLENTMVPRKPQFKCHFDYNNYFDENINNYENRKRRLKSSSMIDINPKKENYNGDIKVSESCKLPIANDICFCCRCMCPFNRCCVLFCCPCGFCCNCCSKCQCITVDNIAESSPYNEKDDYYDGPTLRSSQSIYNSQKKAPNKNKFSFQNNFTKKPNIKKPYNDRYKVQGLVIND